MPDSTDNTPRFDPSRNTFQEELQALNSLYDSSYDALVEDHLEKLDTALSRADKLERDKKELLRRLIELEYTGRSLRRRLEMANVANTRDWIDIGIELTVRLENARECITEHGHSPLPLPTLPPATGSDEGKS